jgi:hypothetical protein
MSCESIDPNQYQDSEQETWDQVAVHFAQVQWSSIIHAIAHSCEGHPFTGQEETCGL